VTLARSLLPAPIDRKLRQLAFLNQIPYVVGVVSFKDFCFNMSLPCRLDHSFDGYAYRAFGVLKVKNRVFHEVMKRLPHSRGLNNFVLSIRFGGRHHPPDPPPIPSRFEINLEVKRH